MKPLQCAVLSIGWAVLLSNPTTAWSQVAVSGDATRFVWSGPRDGGAAIVVSPTGGEYVYSTSTVGLDRPRQRLLLGPLPRQSYSLFSADEEAALASMRDQLLHAHDPVVRRHVAVRLKPVPTAPVTATAPTRPDLNWPRVVIREGKTCVPTLAFADAPDWRDHLVCWSQETRDVE